MLPGAHPALDVARSLEALGLRRLHRHGRTLAEGAIEQELLPRGLGKRMQETVGLQALLDLGIGNV